MKFSKEFLQEMVGEGECKLTDHSRWSLIYEQIFEHDGKHYQTRYRIGATESQDETPYEYDKEEIECPEVKQVERLMKVWEPVTTTKLT